jgi:hypothetical protein
VLKKTALDFACARRNNIPKVIVSFMNRHFGTDGFSQRPDAG